MWADCTPQNKCLSLKVCLGYTTCFWLLLSLATLIKIIKMVYRANYRSYDLLSINWKKILLAGVCYFRNSISPKDVIHKLLHIKTTFLLKFRKMDLANKQVLFTNIVIMLVYITQFMWWEEVEENEIANLRKSRSENRTKILNSYVRMLSAQHWIFNAKVIQLLISDNNFKNYENNSLFKYGFKVKFSHTRI